MKRIIDKTTKIFIRDDENYDNKKDIDVLKLDCEGSEQSIIPCINCSKVGIIFIEFHLNIYGDVYDKSMFWSLVDYLFCNGMKIYYANWSKALNDSCLPFFIFVNEKYCREKKLFKLGGLK